MNKYLPETVDIHQYSWVRNVFDVNLYMKLLKIFQVIKQILWMFREIRCKSKVLKHIF